MKSTPRLQCPNGCKAVERDFKLIRYYGPHRTPDYRCRRCGCELSARSNSVFAGFHTDEETIYRILKALAEGNGMRACARIAVGQHSQAIKDRLFVMPVAVKDGPARLGHDRLAGLALPTLAAFASQAELAQVAGIDVPVVTTIQVPAEGTRRD
jgi:hypothetical protein